MLDSESLYALRRRQHLSLINKLRALGAQADLDLPRIAVIGNQSAGKSSLVEAISGISVPRDAGTCTRCPIECRMADSSEPWACHISIRWEFDDNGSPRDKVQELAFGEAIIDPKDVEPALRQAQAAVLNPSAPTSGFLGMTDVMLKKRFPQNELMFSRNAVCIDLSGPGLVDLAFVDLPGIIQNADQETVQLVEGLVLSHIQGNCLILVTLPMSDDIENQKAMTLARQVDPNGSRTIGVLTKPDTLTSGATQSKESWLAIVEGRDVKFPLSLGYYCTRQPDEDERRAGITNAHARQVENDFFAHTPPWSATTHPQHFGTRNLVANLSKLLTKIIDESLPKIASETAKQLQSCTSRLASLPQLIPEPTSFVLTLLTQFCVQVNSFVEGSLDAASLVQESRAAYGEYKISIRSTAPEFLPYANPNAARAEIGSGRAIKFLQLDDDEGVAMQANPSFLFLDDVRNRINQAITRELPNNTPYVAKVSFIKDFQQNWEAYTQRCVKSVHQALQRTVLYLVREKFGSYGHLEPKIRYVVEGLVRSKLEVAAAQALRVLRYETTPFTQNDHYLSTSKDKFLALYKSARQNVESYPKSASATASAVPPSVVESQTIRQVAQPAVTPLTTTLFGNPSGSTNTELRVADYQQKTKGFASDNTQKKSKADSTPSEPTRSMFGSGATTSTVSGSPSSTAFGSLPTASSNPFSSSFSASPVTHSAAKPDPPQSLFSFAPQPQPQPRSALPALSDEERKREEATILASLAKLGYQGLTATDLGKLVPPDEYEKELEVMAEVRAYFKVAYKRVVDYVPLVIDHEFLRAFGDDLQAHLIKQLGLGAEDAVAKCAAYLEEDPFIVSAREELTGRKKRLESVQEELLRFGL